MRTSLHDWTAKLSTNFRALKFERSLLIQPKQLLLMVVKKWVDMYLQPLLQLVDDESKRERGASFL